MKSQFKKQLYVPHKPSMHVVFINIRIEVSFIFIFYSICDQRGNYSNHMSVGRSSCEPSEAHLALRILCRRGRGWRSVVATVHD